jgi:hypothetical protein
MHTRVRKPSYTNHDGFFMPMGFPVEGFTSAHEYLPQPGDVFVSTYPKCGTTWMQFIVLLLVRKGRGLRDGETINDAFPHLEEVGNDVVTTLSEPRLIKTHLPFDRTPWAACAKYIYVARNPFDCAVSFYHHTRGFPRHYEFADGTFDDYFECFIRGEVDFGDYFDNLLSWLPRRTEPNVLFATYEGMLADPRAAIERVAEFLGETAAVVARDTALLERILEQSSFRGMRENQARWSSERPAEMPAFVRKGIVGDWRNHFSAAQARRLVAKFEQRTKGTGAEHLWSDELSAAKHFASNA